jgi:hypothetical protein
LLSGLHIHITILQKYLTCAKFLKYQIIMKTDYKLPTYPEDPS